MLCLSRRQGESIRIGENIIVKVNYVKNGRVQIGIEAPQEIPIIRAELEEVIDRLEQQPKPKPIVNIPSVFGGVRVA